MRNDDAAATLLGRLKVMADSRARQAAEPGLAARVTALKAYQARRFALTYADLLQQPRYRAAARFFLDELYGPQPFEQRDTQFARIVPALVRLFPADIVATVDLLAALHALSETLDEACARHLPTSVQADTPLDTATYASAWQATGAAGERARQVAMTVQIGQALDRYTRKPLLRHTLRMMRGPAEVAGLSALQRFLEAGFDAFAAMKGADDFLRTVQQREQRLIDLLFSPGAPDWLRQRGAGVPPPAAWQDASAHLP